MKKIHTFKFRRMSVLVCLLFCCCAISAHTASLDEAQKSMSPFVTISTMLQERGLDNVNLLTVVPTETLDWISSQLKRALKVKGYVSFEPNSTVGEILTKLLKEKYGKKANAKNGFLAIQYSTSSSDFEKYLNKYPDSKYADEAKARLNCFKENELWLAAQEKKTREVYEEFANLCAKNTICNYEGCEGIGEQNHKIAETVSKWYEAADKSKGDNPSLFEDYLLQYGSSSPFLKEAADSLKVNHDRYDWNVATTKDTKEAYESYLASHEDGIYGRRAKSMAEQIVLWEKAKTTDKYEDYCAYYTEYPEGRYADGAVKIIKQQEDAAWQQAQKKNTLAAYENFVDKYPSGYYASDAQNKISEIRLAPFLNEPATIGDLDYITGYSQPGYSLVFLGNADNSKTITFSLTGPTGFSKNIRPGSYEWVKLKNGKYKMLLQASNTENYWGTCTVEDRMYYGYWHTVTTKTSRNPWDLLGDEVLKLDEEGDIGEYLRKRAAGNKISNANPEYEKRFERVILERAVKEQEILFE